MHIVRNKTGQLTIVIGGIVRSRREWKDIFPIESNKVFEMTYTPETGHCWPDPLFFRDIRGRHRVVRMLVEIEVVEGYEDDFKYKERNAK